MARIDKNHLTAKVTAGETDAGSNREGDPIQAEVRPVDGKADDLTINNRTPIFRNGLELSPATFGELLRKAQGATWFSGPFLKIEQSLPRWGEPALEQQVQELTEANERLAKTQAQLTARIAALELEITRYTTRLDEHVKELVAVHHSLASKSR